MITVTVDDKACVGCTLCVDECPTKVFEFDEANSIPKVAKPKECFGCLACSEICPADAISHEDVALQEALYHDAYALALASKLTADPKLHVHVLTDKPKRQMAMADLGVRLLSVASVLRQTLGSGLPAVGTIAGRTLANQLPRYKVPKSVAEALERAREQFDPAWEMTPQASGADDFSIQIKGCFVRDLCKKEGIEIGGDLCILFCNYLTGYLGSTASSRIRLMKADRGPDVCTYSMKVYH